MLLAPSLLVASELKSGVLVPLLAEFLPEEYSLDALYPHRDHLPAKVRSFIYDRAGLLRRNGISRANAAPESDAVEISCRASVEFTHLPARILE